MNANQPSKTYRGVMWLSVGLALFTALAYVLINVGALTAGDVPHEEGSTTIAYLAAGCYLLGGLLILLRRRWLWIIGLGMNNSWSSIGAARITQRLWRHSRTQFVFLNEK